MGLKIYYKEGKADELRKSKLGDWLKTQYDLFQKYDASSQNMSLFYKMGELFYNLVDKLGKFPTKEEFEKEVEEKGLIKESNDYKYFLKQCIRG
jgi:hypothetical protein